MIRILGIDPGYGRVGICILDATSINDQKIVYSTCLETKVSLTIDQRILEINRFLERIIQEYKPTELAIEKLYFTKNQKTVMGVAEAKGAIIYLTNSLGLKVFEYTPLQIKNAITGYGRATKNQIYYMLQKLLKIESVSTKSLDDEYDAIAIAYTHAVSRKSYSHFG